MAGNLSRWSKLILLLLFGCLGQEERVYSTKGSLQEEVHWLIQHLEKADDRVKPYFFQRLEELTRLCFDHKNPKKAVEQWKQWWQQARHKSPDLWLVEAAEDPSYPYRQRALRDLWNFPFSEEAAKAVLSLILQEDTPLLLQVEGLKLLRHWRYQRVVQVLPRFLSSDQPLLLREALLCAAYLQYSVDATPFLTHSSPKVREAALELLYRQSKAAKAPLIQALKDPSLAVAYRAFSILKELLPKKELKELLQGLSPRRRRIFLANLGL